LTRIMNKLIAPAKKALAEKYGFRNVSVRNGQGTAWGWVEVSITIDKPANFSMLDENGFYSRECRGNMDTISREAKQIMSKAWDKLGLKPYTYCSDDGYNSEKDDVLIDIKYK
jgi:hypothetical protein